MTPTQYWKLVATIERLSRQEREMAIAKQAAIAEAGLDPSKNYALNDADCSATEQSLSADTSETEKANL